MSSAIETWKDIPGYEGVYMASTEGRIKRLFRGKIPGKGGRERPEKILKNILNKSGYCYISLYKNKVQKVYLVHCVIAMTFLNYRPLKGIIAVDHINHIRDDNRLENLQVLTVRQNVIKSSTNKTGFTGVYKAQRIKRYYVEIKIDGRLKNLGRFDSKEAASLAYEKALKEQHENEMNFLKQMGYL